MRSNEKQLVLDEELTWRGLHQKWEGLKKESVKKNASVSAKQHSSSSLSTITMLDLLSKDLNNTQLDSIPRDVFVHRPVCVGFDEEPSPQQLLAEAKSALNKGYQFRVYLEVRNEGALARWKKNNVELVRLLRATHFNEGSSIVCLNAYKNEPAGKRAEEAFNVNYQALHHEQIEKIVEKRIESIKSKYAEATAQEKANMQNDKEHPIHWTLEQVREHTASNAKVILSWLEPLASNSKRINVMFYEHHAIKDYDYLMKDKVATKMGYDKQTFVRLYPKYKSLEPTHSHATKTTNTISDSLTTTSVMDAFQHLLAAQRRQEGGKLTNEQMAQMFLDLSEVFRQMPKYVRYTKQGMGQTQMDCANVAQPSPVAPTTGSFFRSCSSENLQSQENIISQAPTIR